MASGTGAHSVRPEIQALRALAVTLVVVGHLWPSALRGGFVGVDVFFVISGFLITALLLRELERDGRISLVAFWARRARRILPAALVTLLFSVVAILLVVPVSYWKGWFAEVTASTLYVQNWRLADMAVDYFAADDAASPVQHFWSLSVEEQFYLVWPLLLGLATAVALKRSARARRVSIAVAMGALTLGTLAWGIHHTATDQAAAYFQTPTRAWEFGAGGLLALAGGLLRAPHAARAALSWAGLAAIAVAAVAYSPDTPFPGVAALLPVLGTVAVIAAGVPTARWAPTRLLAARPVQWLGDVSYSTYLWHWPLLVLAPFVVSDGSATTTLIGVLMLTLLAAWLSKRLVEDPVRSGRFLLGRPARWTFATAVTGSALVLGVTASGASQVDAVARVDADASKRVLASQPTCFGAASRDPEEACRNAALRLKVVPTPLQARSDENEPCTYLENTPTWNVCAFGTKPKNAVTTAAVIGDSHAGHWRGAINVMARRKSWRGLSIHRHGCPLTKATMNVPEPDRSECAAWNKRVLRYLGRHPEIRTVFVSTIAGGRGVVPSGGRDRYETEVDGYLRAWKALPESVERVVVIRDTPKAEKDTDVCVDRARAARKPAGTACAMPRGEVLDRDYAAVAAQRVKDDRVTLVDLSEFFCDAKECFPVVGGALVHKDKTHLTKVFARTLGPFLTREFDQL